MYLKLKTQNSKLTLMPYIITVLNDSPQALAYVKEAETLDFVKVTKTKETKKKTATKAKATPAPAEPIFEEETQEQYEMIMALSKETNRAIAHKINKIKNLNLPL